MWHTPRPASATEPNAKATFRTMMLPGPAGSSAAMSIGTSAAGTVAP
jgi:hypothetical protein